MVLTTLISGPYKTKKIMMVLTTQIDGPYNTNIRSYINDCSNCATYYIVILAQPEANPEHSVSYVSTVEA